jgi:hypothetical protein
MSARESWARRRTRRPERGEAALGSGLAVTGLVDAVHRSDRCGAHAYVRILLPSAVTGYVRPV